MVADQETKISPALALFVVAAVVIGYAIITADKAPPKKFTYRKVKGKRS